MILDYSYNNYKRNLSISYINDKGMKDLISFNVTRFKSYYCTPTGKYKNWDGTPCDIRWVDDPHKFDIRTFFEELPADKKSLLHGKITPKLYTFDIETEISDEFPEPAEAKFPITTISIASSDCNVIVLGTKDLPEGGDINLQQRFEEYLSKSEYFNSLRMKMPYIRYIKFNTEYDMLKYFLTTIVAKVPILAGWNSIMFDWQYIQNRVQGYYKNLSLACSSINKQTTIKYCTDMRNNKVRLTIPQHTLILDMMDVVGNFDYVVMPIKESLSLDYIASESVGLNKIKYDGDLQKLFEEDYSTYVFYNAIDSILVQLIDKKFKTLNNIYTQSLYCKEKIGSCFSKIALTDALFFNYFYDHNIKIVPMDTRDRERGVLVGAYVATPVPGKHNWVACNDFASLYPSVIRTCNISIENFEGTFYDEVALAPYKINKKDYVVVGGTVYKNNGSESDPRLGEYVTTCLLEDELDIYRKDPNYFVSVNGHVYKNDKDYAFKCIQEELANNRNKAKYLSKDLDAYVLYDIDHIQLGKHVDNRIYKDNIRECLRNLLGVEVTCSDDLFDFKDQLNDFHYKIKNEVMYLGSYEQACKYLMNSLYGGSSHVAFSFFKLELANDITGEAKNLIHLMEDHIPKWFEQNWLTATDLHKKLGIKIKPELLKNSLKN